MTLAFDRVDHLAADEYAATMRSTATTPERQLAMAVIDQAWRDATRTSDATAEGRRIRHDARSWLLDDSDRPWSFRGLWGLLGMPDGAIGLARAAMLAAPPPRQSQHGIATGEQGRGHKRWRG